MNGCFCGWKNINDKKASHAKNREYFLAFFFLIALNEHSCSLGVKVLNNCKEENNPKHSRVLNTIHFVQKALGGLR